MTNIEKIKRHIIDLMKSNKYLPSTLEELIVHFSLTKKDVPRFKKLLNSLLVEGKIAKVKGGRYAISADMDLVGGILNFRQSGWAYLKPSDGSAEIEVRPEDTGLAFNGDKVLARIYRPTIERFRGFRKGKRPKFYNLEDSKTYAKVIKILERTNNIVVGTLVKNYNFWHVIADDPKFYYDVIVANSKDIEAQNGDKVVVELDEWKQKHLNPTGKIIENLGESHTPMSEYKAILRKYDLHPEFAEEVMAEVEAIPQEVSEEDIKGRLDLRNAFVITIDPQDSKDFDDAISIRKVDGLCEIGVHIADVSAYVKPNTALDKSAYKRGNSTYLVGTVVPMLPFELSNGICSLVEDKDRLVKSVFLRYDDKGVRKNVSFANSVIRSKKRLSYEQAYAFLKEDDLEKIKAQKAPEAYETGFRGKELSQIDDDDLRLIQENLRKFWDIAEILRKARMKKGSLDLQMNEVIIHCDEEGYADRITKSKDDESHQLIEEFMLAANEAVAEELFSKSIPYISRVHDKPDMEKLSELQNELLAFDVKTGDLSSNKNLNKLLELLKNHPQGSILKIKVLRSLKKAVYRASADRHFGLNKKYYAHFTSPIRRYADLIVHRTLNFYMQKNKIATALKDKAKLLSVSNQEEIANYISRTEQQSAQAERDSHKVKLMEYFEKAKVNNEKFEAIITNITNHGFFIELTESLAYGFVHIRTLRDDIYKYDEYAMQLRGRRTGNSYELAQKIMVKVEKIDRYKQQIDFYITDVSAKGKKRNK